MKYFIFFLISLLISLYPAFRDFGLDLENYKQMFSAILSLNTFHEKLFFAKDITFLLISELTSVLSKNPDVKILFFLFCFISIFLKLIVFNKFFPSKWLYFFIFYIIFFAPGLEFAAIRSGLALSFLLVATSIHGKKTLIFITLSFLSHLSYILPSFFFLISRYIKRNNQLLIYIFIFLLFIFFGKFIGDLYPQASIYQNDQASVFAYPHLFIILAFLFFVFYNKKQINEISYLELRSVSISLFSSAAGLMPYYVTASFRYNEIVLVMASICFFMNFQRTIKDYLILFFMILYLFLFNIQRKTWIHLFIPPEI